MLAVARPGGIALSRREQRRRPLPRRRRAGPPFPLNIIFSSKTVYVIFIVVIIASMAAVGLGGITGGQQTTARQEPSPVPSPTPGQTPTNIPQFSNPEQVIEPGRSYEAVLETEKGRIRIQLFADRAPQAVNSFVFLAQRGFYNGLVFHIVRRDAGFAQAGDPTCRADGSLPCTGAAGPGYTLPFEDSGVGHVRGAVAMAPIAGGGDISGSQFYIVLRDHPLWDSRDTVFGQVVEGMEVVESLTERNPCFDEPSPQNPCQEAPPRGDAILSVQIRSS